MRESHVGWTDQEDAGGLPAQGEDGGAPREGPGQEERAADARPDLVADTVEALQARRDDGDRDALRGTLDPSSPAVPDVERDPANG